VSNLRIVVFAKAPLAGLAKTRLIPALGAGGAAALAARMLAHTLEQALLAGVGKVELCATPAPGTGAWRDIAVPAAVVWSAQGEGDLGARMARAAQRVTAAGEAVLVIGTDCPALDAARLREAAAALQAADAVIAPAADGGYALLGMHRFDSRVFRDIAWSTADVARITLQRLQALGWSVARLPPVRDIDEPRDLQWLPDGWREAEGGRRPAASPLEEQAGRPK
jgi:rSAM/selenodomain-associated transferase 1